MNFPRAESRWCGRCARHVLAYPAPGWLNLLFPWLWLKGRRAYLCHHCRKAV